MCRNLRWAGTQMAGAHGARPLRRPPGTHLCGSLVNTARVTGVEGMTQSRERSRARLVTVLALGVAAVLPAASARALPVVGTRFGVFADPEIEGGGVFRGEDTDRLTWGTGSRRRPRHVLSFASSRIDADSGDVFSLGTVHYRNNKRAGVASVDLLIGLAFTTPAGGEAGLAFALTLVHTPRAAPDGVLAAADLPKVTFTIAGGEYTLEIVGLEAQGKKRKKKYGSAQILARIIPNSSASVPTPEPDAALLYLVGLAVVGTRLRRRRT